MSANEHHSEASNVGRYYTGKVVSNDADVIALGQIEATLALAYEQRTANLIAFLQPVNTGEDTVVYAHTETALKSLTEIAARLGVQPDGSVPE